MNQSIYFIRIFSIKILLLFSGSQSTVIGQTVFLKSQAEVDSFDPTTTVINGDLHIGYLQGQNNPTDITNLSNLANIETINGKLSIIKNPLLTNLTGLNNVKSIIDISIINNSNIKNIDSFESLESVSGNIFISNNDSLQSVAQLAFLHTLEGNLSLSGNESLASLQGLENIVEINGDLRLSGLAITTLDVFQNVEEIGGSLTISNNSNLAEITGFSNLKSIGKFLSISSCGGSFTSMNSFNKLETIAEYFRLYSCQSLLSLDGFSGLKEVGGGFEISFNYDLVSIFGLNKISKIGGNIKLSNNHDLKNITFLNKVNFIEGNLVLHTNNSIESLLPLSKVESIEGDLNLTQNYGLKSLDGLNRIKRIGGTLEVYNQKSITDLDIFRNLKTIGGDLNLIGNIKLNNIDGLNNLRYFDGSIEITNNHKIYDIDGLKSITSCEDLRVYDNDNLIHINGIINIKEIRKDLSVTYNQSLSNCCGLWVLDANPTVTIGGSISLSNNGPDCENIDITKCGVGLIEGKIFYDQNQNEIQDSFEYGIPNIAVDYIGDGKLNFTDDKGNFYLPVEDNNTYTVIPSIPEELDLTTGFSQYVINYNVDNIRYNNYTFGLVAPEPYSSGNINLYLDELRCNSIIDCDIQVLNDGFEIESGIVRVEFHDSLSVIDSIILSIDSLGYYVTFDSLYPYETFTIGLQIQTPSELFTGEVVDINASLFYNMESTEIILMDTALYETEVRCSYDPNDKQVSPIGIKDQNYTLIDDELLYTIRFQNTGNAPAIDVKILDTLDVNLNLNSFKVVNSSHELNTSINGYAIEFLFNDIWLIDSLTNKEESQGYLQYVIRPNPNVEVLTEIDNTAHIIFDSNPAIITNTTKNTMVDTICEDQYITEQVMICEGEEFMGFTETGNYDLEYPAGITCDSFVALELIVLPSDDPLCAVNTKDEYSSSLIISPNPFKEELVIKLNDGLIKTISFYDVQGSKIIELSNAVSIDTRNLTSGIYILEVITDDNYRIIEKVVKE